MAKTNVEWAIATSLLHATQAALAKQLETRPHLSPDAERLLGRQLIQDQIDKLARERLSEGLAELSPEAERDLAAAVFAGLFEMGRLQPLLNDQQIENIEISGFDRVVLEYSDGSVVESEPVADSDDDLIEQIRYIAARLGRSERTLTRGHPHLNMRLPDGSRLAAMIETVPRPEIVIRRHRIRDIDLDDLVGLGTLDEVLVEFLRAAVRARKNIIVTGGMGSGKALALDTPLPTPDGWTTMGWLRAGDRVFDEQGQPCTVLAAHEVRTDRRCYEVLFSDGSTITADAEHLWQVTRFADRQRVGRSAWSRPSFWVSDAERARLWALADEAGAVPDRSVTVSELVCEVGAEHRTLIADEARRLPSDGRPGMSFVRSNGRPGRTFVATYSRAALLKALAARRDRSRGGLPRGPEHVVMTTEQLLEHGLVRSEGTRQASREFAVDLCRPLEYQRKCQPIDPYVLGAWLGDGATSAARLSTADPEILAEFEAAGYPCRHVANYDYAVAGSLQSQLRAAGVLGDKHIPREYLHGDTAQRLALLQGLMDTDGHCKPGGTAEFSTTSEVLFRQVFELAAGLGIQPQRRQKPLVWKGRVTGVAYTVSWTSAIHVFRLPRKAARISQGSRRDRPRLIAAIRPVPSVPVRCITVDSPNSLYLAGEACIPTHNTTLIRAMANEIHPSERFGTIETEFELLLHELPDRHPRVVPMEALEGTGERGPDGRQLGEVTLTDLVWQAWRMNLQRILVGEIRGPEIGAVMKVMIGSEGGSMSTLHARSAHDAFERMVDLRLESSTATAEFAYRMAARAVHLVVHIRLLDEGYPVHTRRRFVSQVVEVNGIGEGGRPALTDIFAPGPDGRAAPLVRPVDLDDYTQVGFDPAWLDLREGRWGPWDAKRRRLA